VTQIHEEHLTILRVHPTPLFLSLGIIEIGVMGPKLRISGRGQSEVPNQRIKKYILHRVKSFSFKKTKMFSFKENFPFCNFCEHPWSLL